MAAKHERDERARQEAQLVAALYAEGKLDQKAIARCLSMSQSRVSRLLKIARDEGWLQLVVRVPEEQRREAQRILFSDQLELRLRDHLKPGADRLRTLRIFGTEPETDDTREQRQQQFGSGAAWWIEKLLRRAGTLGITWGNTLLRLVDEICARNVGLPDRDWNIRFVPLCGEPLGYPATEISSSTLAARLHRQFGGSSRPPPSLSSIPASLPQRLSPEKRRIIRKDYIAETPGYQDVFGDGAQGGTALIDQVTTILTSVSHSEYSVTFGHQGLIQSNQPAKLRRSVLGDIGGVLVPRRDGGRKAEAEAKRETKKFNKLWTGANQEHFERCARRSTDHHGVVVAAFSSKKAPIVSELVRLGWINHLAIDQHLARELERLCLEEK